MDKKKEPTTEKLKLVQPNSVTSAKYDYTECQENVITEIYDALQKHMTQKQPIQMDILDNPTLVVNASTIVEGRNKAYVLQQAQKLRDQAIEFDYVNQKGQTEGVYTGIINTVRDIRETNYIELEISKWAIPYLIYWGKGVGGTIYRKSMALTIKGIYAKRLYKLCCRWENQGGFQMSLDKFRGLFNLEKKYKRLTDLRRWVLDPSAKELKRNADLYFEYSMNKVQSRSYNNIGFQIFSNNKEEIKKIDDWYLFVYNFVCRTYPSYKNDKAMVITDQLAEDSSVLRRAKNAFTKLDDQFTAGSKTGEDVIKLTKYILKEDFNIK